MEHLNIVGDKKIIGIYPKHIKPPLGYGRSCTVYHGSYDKQEVAVKRIVRDEVKFEKEAVELRKLKNPNIVHYYFFDSDDDFEYVVMEKCVCSLEEYFRNKDAINIRLPKLEVMKDISAGLHFLHMNNRIHRNLHPSNILLSQTLDVRRPIVAKIADFGIMKISPDGLSVDCSGQTGSRRYHNPEEVRKQKVNKKSDVFSLGLCFFAVLTENKNPYGEDEVGISSAIFHEKRCDLSEISQAFNGYAAFLIRIMLDNDCKCRPSTAEVLSHYLFWDSSKIIIFLQEASDFVKGNHWLAEGLKSAVANADWRKTLYEDLDDDAIRIFEEHFHDSPPYGYGPPRGADGLLRQVRNWCHHFYELKPHQVQNLLGGTKENMIEMMAKKFPRLLPVTYDQLRSVNDLSRFYHPEVN